MIQSNKILFAPMYAVKGFLWIRVCHKCKNPEPCSARTVVPPFFVSVLTFFFFSPLFQPLNMMCHRRLPSFPSLSQEADSDSMRLRRGTECLHTGIKEKVSSFNNVLMMNLHQSFSYGKERILASASSSWSITWKS